MDYDNKMFKLPNSNSFSFNLFLDGGFMRMRNDSLANSHITFHFSGDSTT